MNSDKQKTKAFLETIERAAADAERREGGQNYADMLRLYGPLMSAYLKWSAKMTGRPTPEVLDSIVGAMATMLAGIVRTIANENPDASAELGAQAAIAFAEHLNEQIRGAKLYGALGRLDG